MIRRLWCRIVGHASFHDYGTHRQVCERCDRHVDNDPSLPHCTICGRNINRP